MSKLINGESPRKSTKQLRSAAEVPKESIDKFIGNCLICVLCGNEQMQHLALSELESALQSGVLAYKDLLSHHDSTGSSNARKRYEHATNDQKENPGSMSRDVSTVVTVSTDICKIRRAIELSKYILEIRPTLDISENEKFKTEVIKALKTNPETGTPPSHQMRMIEVRKIIATAMKATASKTAAAAATAVTALELAPATAVTAAPRRTIALAHFS